MNAEREAVEIIDNVTLRYYRDAGGCWWTQRLDATYSGARSPSPLRPVAMTDAEARELRAVGTVRRGALT